MSPLGATVIAVGGALIMRGKMDYIDLITFTLYVSTFVTPLRKLANFSEVYVQGTVGFNRFLELMRTEPSIQDTPDAEELGKIQGDIVYDHVTFAYDGAAEPVLRDVSLHVTPGECLAVVRSVDVPIRGPGSGSRCVGGIRSRGRGTGSGPQCAPVPRRGGRCGPAGAP